MAGVFRGLHDDGWAMLSDLFPEPAKRGRGYPKTPTRFIVNSLLYILITGCRWVDIPKGENWCSKSAAHRWLKVWEEDGTLQRLTQRLLEIAEKNGLIDWQQGAIDGSFSPREGRR